MKPQACAVRRISKPQTPITRRQENFWHYSIRLAVLLGLTLPSLSIMASAPVVWTGPSITFTKASSGDPTQAANQDRITPNVWITRADSQGIYNAKQESFFTHFSSPLDTEWANGTTANYNTLTYTNWNYWAKGVNAGPPLTVGVNAVLHLKTDNIYIDVKFQSWDSSGIGGAFSYTRSTPAAASNNPPSVSITNPVSGTAFSAPANITLQATAEDTDGSVTQVEFFNNGTSAGVLTTPPYTLMVTNLSAAVYTFSAVATDNLNATTTNSINVTVTNAPAAPAPVQIVNPGFQFGAFDFSFLTQTGYTYTVQFATELDPINWIDLTNFPGDGSVAQVSDTTATNLSRWYRVGAH
jgi:hypothetical protein